MHTRDLYLIQCNGSKWSCISLLFAYNKSADIAAARWVKSTSSSRKRLCFFSFSIARWVVHWPGGLIPPVLHLPKHKSWYRWIGWRTKLGVWAGGSNHLQRWKVQHETLRSVCENMVWEWLSTEITGISSTAPSCFEQGGKQPQENLLSCNTVSLHGCANRHESAKRRAVSVLHWEHRKGPSSVVTLSPHFALEYVKDRVATVVLSKKQQSRSNGASGMLKLKQYPFVIWLPGARRLPPWWHLWKSPQSHFSEVCSYSAPVPPFTTLRWWSALFMDSNGTFFFQNNHFIIGIMPLIVCYGLSNTWGVNNSWLSAIWSIVGADWRLTIKAFKNN